MNWQKFEPDARLAWNTVLGPVAGAGSQIATIESDNRVVAGTSPSCVRAIDGGCMSKKESGRDTMYKRIAWLFLIGALAVGFQGIVTETASAHSLTVTASASCVNGAPVISYTA